MSGSHAVVRVVRRPLRAGFALAALLALAAPLSSARAQVPAPAKEMNDYVNSEGNVVDLTPFKADHPRKMNQLQGPLLQVINVGKGTPQEMLGIETLAWIHIAQLTWPSGDPAQTFEQRRFKTKTRWLSRPLGTQDGGQVLDVHDRANAAMLKGLPIIVGDNQYSLPSRFNAMILLGQLDKIEPDIIKGRVAVPMAETMPLLLKAYEAAAFPESLRLAALVGVERQCGLQVAPADRKPVTDALLTLLNEKAPPAGFSLVGFHWARKLALQSVASLGLAGATEANRPEFVVAIHQIIADDKQPLFLRREGCQALGSLNKGTLVAAGVKPNELVKSIANFALAVSKAGAPRVDPTAPLDLSKAEDVMPTPVEGPGFNLPGVRPLGKSTEPKKLFADAVTYYLHAISLALGGRDTEHGLLNAGGIDPNIQATAKSLLNDHVNPMLTAMNRQVNQLAAVRLAEDLKQARTKLETWMQAQPLIAAPARAAPQVGAGPPAGAGGALGVPQPAPPPPSP